MDLIYLILGLALIGFLAWILTTKVPMDPIFKILIYVVVAVAVVLFLLRKFSSHIANVLG